MLANIVDEKVHDLVHHSPRKMCEENGPRTPGARGGLSVKTRQRRASDQTVALSLGKLRGDFAQNGANLKPWPLSPVMSSVLSCPGRVSMIKSSSGVLS